MATRELVAFTIGPLVLAAIIWLPAWVFLVVMAAVVTGAADELLRMARSAGLASGRILFVLMVPAVMASAWIAGAIGLVAAMGAVLLVTPVLQLRHPEAPKGALAGVGVSAFAVLYLGLTGTCFGWIRLLPGDALGWRLVVLFMVTVWVGDSGAYYVGRRLGRHRMSPRISPNKTWEGLAGGVVASLGGAAVLKPLLALEIGWTHVLVVAAIVALTAPVGDLVESLFKRDTGVKDSSGLLLGHGGLLDRTDSLLFAAPAVLAYLLAVGI